MKKGVLDIGSNTVKFKIFDEDQLLVFHTYPVQIGTGLKDQSLSKEMITKIRDCLEQVYEELQNCQAEMSRIIGTSALRDAKNASEVIEYIESIFKLPLEIIPGNQEAELIYKGVRKGINFHEKYLICDIGGGSVELIYCSNQELIKANSFEVGVIKLFKLRKCSDPMSEQDVQFYNNYLEKEFEVFLEEVHTDYLVGAAGSFESLYTLNTNNPYSGRFENIEINDLKAVLDDVLESTHQERVENQLIPFEREVLLPLGSILVKYLINKLEINKFTVSPNSLIEGLEL